MAKACDEVVLDWWKNKSSDYTLDDIFYLNSSSRNEFVLNIDRGSSIIEINPWS